MEEALDKHLPKAQHRSGAGLTKVQQHRNEVELPKVQQHRNGKGLPNIQHGSEVENPSQRSGLEGERVGSEEQTVLETGNSEFAHEEDQKQIKKPQQVGLWLLTRKASKEGQRLQLSQNPQGREGRQIHSADPGALMYLPLGGSKSVR